MPRSRTNNLHRRLPTEVRDKVIRDLVDKPPGRATADEVWKYHRLAELYGIGVGVVRRYNTYLRQIVDNQKFAELVWAKQKGMPIKQVTNLLRARTLEMGTRDDLSPGDLLKLAASINAVAGADKTYIEEQIRTVDLEAKRTAMKKAVEAKAAKSPDRKLSTSEVAEIIDSVMRGEAIDE